MNTQNDFNKNKNRRIKIVLGTAIVLLCMVQTVFSKPMSSVKVTMNWVEQPIENQVSTIDISILSQLDSDNLRFNLSLPSGVRLISGQEYSVFVVKKGVEKHISIEVFVEEKAQGEITTEVSIGARGKTFFSSKGVLFIDFSNNISQMKARQRAEPAFKRTERDGVSLREYRISQ